MKRLLLLALCISAACDAMSQENIPDSLIGRLMKYAYAASNFGKTLPQEKVYLHLDNTSYYRGDKIWFQCYVATAATNQPTSLSRTLYVELLNPGGTVVEKMVLPVSEGRCHGNFTLSQIPFYSGFYEIRAYTKYMLNFGEQTIYSRIIPVFDKPHEESATDEKRMMRPRMANGKYPLKRKYEKREHKVNVRFYPEGGNLVAGLPSRVAFEATDAEGRALTLDGRIFDRHGIAKAEFTVTHDGRGAFDYTPDEGDRAEVSANDRTYGVDLPKPLRQGVVMRVDNTSSPDSVMITVRKSAGTPAAILGAAVMCGGMLVNYSLLDIADDSPLQFAVGKSKLRAGVARILLTDPDGQIIADRLIFAGTGERARITVDADRPAYGPYDPVRLDLSVCNRAGIPLTSPLSVSVRDGQDETAYYGNMLTDLLLMSEIRGYVRRPSYYFESDDARHREALDQLLMVQGWRRYDWKLWSGTEPFDMKYLPEQGVEVRGQVLRYGTDKPMTDIQLSSMLLKRGEEDKEGDDSAADDAARLSAGNSAHVGILEVDSTGRFAFVSNMWGKWSLTLAVTNDKNRRKASRILLDRAFSPEPRNYRAADMLVETADTAGMASGTGETSGDTADPAEPLNYYDEEDDGETDMTKKVHRIKEVVIKGKKRSREEEIYRNRSTSVAYYDVPSEIDAIRDGGELVGDIYELLAAVNDKFIISRMSVGTFNSMRDSSQMADSSSVTGQWRISYKGKLPLFVVDHERVWGRVPLHDVIRLAAIKSIYVNEDPRVITQYADLTKMTPWEATSTFSCAVFIETYPEGHIPVDGARGVRKTWIDGYRTPDEFYMPDYSVMPKDDDYRRTLYWNPELIPDAEGHATIRFYNNGRCRRMKISAETLAPDGSIGVLNM